MAWQDELTLDALTAMCCGVPPVYPDQKRPFELLPEIHWRYAKPDQSRRYTGNKLLNVFREEQSDLTAQERSDRRYNGG